MVLDAFSHPFPSFSRLGSISNHFLIENDWKLRNEHAFVRILSMKKKRQTYRLDKVY